MIRRSSPGSRSYEVLSLTGGTAGGQDGLILHVRVVLGLSDGTTRGVICSTTGVPHAGGRSDLNPCGATKVARPYIGLVDLDPFPGHLRQQAQYGQPDQEPSQITGEVLGRGPGRSPGRWSRSTRCCSSTQSWSKVRDNQVKQNKPA